MPMTDIEYKKEAIKGLNEDELATLIWMLPRFSTPAGEYTHSLLAGKLTARTLEAFFKCTTTLYYFGSKGIFGDFISLLKNGERFSHKFIEYISGYCVPSTVFSLAISITEFTEKEFIDDYQKYSLWKYPEAIRELKKVYPWIIKNEAIKMLKKLNANNDNRPSVADRDGHRVLRSLKGRLPSEICAHITAFDWNHIMSNKKLKGDPNAALYLSKTLEIGDYWSREELAEYTETIDDYVLIGEAIYTGAASLMNRGVNSPKLAPEQELIDYTTKLISTKPFFKDILNKKRTTEAENLIGKTAKNFYEVFSGDLIPESLIEKIGHNIKIEDFILPVVAWATNPKEKKMIEKRAKKFKKIVSRIIK